MKATEKSVVICLLANPYNDTARQADHWRVHMRRKIPSTIAIYGVVLLLLIWPSLQLYGLLQNKAEKADATYLLYQVSLFQMELLGSYLQQVGKLQDTGGLDALKQSLYAVEYTHERLVLAVGSDQLVQLDGINLLLQYTLRLQIGGQRLLKPEEKEILQDAANRIQDMYAIYGNLMSSAGGIVSSQNDKLGKLDKQFGQEVHRKLLQ
jgi:hypothetical protein